MEKIRGGRSIRKLLPKGNGSQQSRKRWGKAAVPGDGKGERD